MKFLTYPRWLLLVGWVALSVQLPTALAQPSPRTAATFAGITQWQFRLHLEYERHDPAVTEQATSDWIGTLDPDPTELLDRIPPAPNATYWATRTRPDHQGLLWTGNVSVTAEGSGRYEHGEGCYTTVKGNVVNVRDGFGLVIYKDHYTFNWAIQNAEGANGVTHCPGRPDTESPWGLTYSGAWAVIHPLPETGWALTGGVTIECPAAGANCSHYADDGMGQYRLTISWDIQPGDNFVCGPDVTMQVTNTLHQIEDWFKALSKKDKVAQCKALHSLTTGYKAWDIRPLYGSGAFWLDTYTKNGTCCVPGDGVPNETEDPATCKHSVRFKGKCVLGGTLNYVQWGLMHKLCHDYALESARDQQPTDEYLSPPDFDAPWLMELIYWYKRADPNDVQDPTRVALSTFFGGVEGAMAVGNRGFCEGECVPPNPPDKEAYFPWRWLPGHGAGD